MVKIILRNLKKKIRQGIVRVRKDRKSVREGRLFWFGPLNEVYIPHDYYISELKHDPSFWTDHNVQVLIRIRPVSNMEKLSQGNGRCLKQESAQTLIWLRHPETRFTFDHIGCENLSQLREDMKKGVYVDNLSEHSVVTVNDVLRLLVQVEFCDKIFLQFELTKLEILDVHFNCQT
ncbi:phragmoplast orienting kinesin [Trifolium repens]|nr:phragmoplast orienting kinesin [Trifolium repens]